MAESKRDENLAFRRYLAAHHQPIEPFQILAGAIQQQTDCTACANCCRFTLVDVSEAEIETIARHLDISAADVTRRFTAPDPDVPRRRILINRHNACTFLDGNLCMIYEARPKACRDFPHVASPNHSLGSRLASICRSASFCPILFNALERYKELLGYHPRHHDDH
jgi:Fe-S-cluster containining protein